MADKKMTQKRALEIAIAFLDIEDADNTEVAEAIEILEGMLEKKSVSRPRKVDEHTAVFRSKIVEILEGAEKPLTNKQIQEKLQEMVDAGDLTLAPDKEGNPVTKVSPQRVANNIKVFERNGIIVRKVGEKPSDKDSFVLADNE